MNERAKKRWNWRMPLHRDDFSFLFSALFPSLDVKFPFFSGRIWIIEMDFFIVFFLVSLRKRNSQKWQYWIYKMLWKKGTQGDPDFWFWVKIDDIYYFIQRNRSHLKIEIGRQIGWKLLRAVPRFPSPAHNPISLLLISYVQWHFKPSAFWVCSCTFFLPKKKIHILTHWAVVVRPFPQWLAEYIIEQSHSTKSKRVNNLELEWRDRFFFSERKFVFVCMLFPILVSSIILILMCSIW